MSRLRAKTPIPTDASTQPHCGDESEASLTTIKHVCVPRSDNWPCFAGSGECLTPAEFCFDPGDGSDVYACPAHWEEFKAMDKLLSTWSKEELARFEKCIEEAE